MKRNNILMAAMLSAVLGASVLASGCSKKAEETTAAETTEEASETETEAESEETEIATESENESDALDMKNPFTDCETMEAAEELAGFTMECPTFDDMENKTYQAVEGQLIQVFNRGDGGGENAYILVRKAPITDDLKAEDGAVDISGDYNSYSIEKEITIGDTSVTAKGNTEDEYSVVIWNDGEYAYSIGLVGVTIPENVIEVYAPLIK